MTLTAALWPHRRRAVDRRARAVGGLLLLLGFVVLADPGLARDAGFPLSVAAARRRSCWWRLPVGATPRAGRWPALADALAPSP